VKGIKYIAPYRDHSGYGEASRNYILALDRAGVPITIEPHCFEVSPPPVGTLEEQAIILSLENKHIDFDVVIIHLTPDLAPAHAAKYTDKYVISYTVWETSALHPIWAGACNGVDEVWVPCDWNVRAFKGSGVVKPVLKIPHGIDPETYTNTDQSLFSIPGVSPDTYVFYSIMQWNSRKNPDGLLRAYFNAFTQEEDVRLVLKAYVGRGLSPQEEMSQLKEMILKVKRDMNLSSFPKMSLITTILSTEQMRALHLYGDAYVSLTHGEGFGLTMLEAGLAGNPVIATGMGGNMEYMTEENSYPVSFMWDYVAGMGGFNPWYLGEQQWGRPSLVEASELMRHVYEDRADSKNKGDALRSRIRAEFSWDIVAQKMLSRLEEL